MFSSRQLPRKRQSNFSQMNWLPGNPPDGPFITVRSRQVYWVEPRKKAGGEESTLQSPVGKWKVKIGDWTGLFVFKQDGSCSWSESGQEHPGTWKIVGGEVQWTYKDDPKGWERVFHAKPLPLKSKMSGEATIKGVNHGYYEMSKLT
jgi:hypothetical protein